jgi:ferredoxin
VPGAKKGFYHVIAQDAVTFSELLLDLNEIIRPNLTIMDGIIGMEGDGPAAGNPRHIGVIIAGTDTIAVDTVSAAVVGIENKIPLLKIARSRDIKQATLSNIRLVGEPIAAIKIKNFKLPTNPLIYAIPSWGIKLGRTIFAAKPIVDKMLCISCANCEKVCPAEAIAMKNKYPHFDYKKCIRCYCCQESCPSKAIKLKENSLRKLLFLKYNKGDK